MVAAVRSPRVTTNGLCRYPNASVYLDPYLIWQATKSNVERGNAFGLVSHKGYSSAPVAAYNVLTLPAIGRRHSCRHSHGEEARMPNSGQPTIRLGATVNRSDDFSVPCDARPTSVFRLTACSHQRRRAHLKFSRKALGSWSAALSAPSPGPPSRMAPPCRR